MQQKVTFVEKNSNKNVGTIKKLEINLHVNTEAQHIAFVI